MFFSVFWLSMHILERKLPGNMQEDIVALIVHVFFSFLPTPIGGKRCSSQCHKPNFLQGFTSNETWIDVHGLVIVHKGRFWTDFWARFGDTFWLAIRNLLDFSTFVSIFFQLYPVLLATKERWSRPKSFWVTSSARFSSYMAKSKWTNLFERSEFLIATCKKKKTDRPDVCTHNLLVLVWKNCLGSSDRSGNRKRPKHGIPCLLYTSPSPRD